MNDPIYGLFKVAFEPHLNTSLLVVSRDADKLVHQYNILDRDEIRGAKLMELPWTTPEKKEKLRDLYKLSKTHYVIDQLDEV